MAREERRSPQRGSFGVGTWEREQGQQRGCLVRSQELPRDSVRDSHAAVRAWLGTTFRLGSGRSKGATVQGETYLQVREVGLWGRLSWTARHLGLGRAGLVPDGNAGWVTLLARRERRQELPMPASPAG